MTDGGIIHLKSLTMESLLVCFWLES